MERLTRMILITLLAVGVGLGSGCLWHEDDGYDDRYYEYYDDYYYDDYYWDDDIFTLYTHDYACGTDDVDWAVDTITLTGDDWDLTDLYFNFTLANEGYDMTTVWVMLCDYLGCEDVIVIDLMPGEVYWDSVPNPVLDSMMEEFGWCLDDFGSGCYFEYDVEVYLGQDFACSSVALDYYYEAFYL